MARRRGEIDAAVRLFRGLPPAGKAAVGVLLAVGLAVYLVAQGCRRPPGRPDAPVPPGTVVFMWWNVENLFDDQDDRRNSTDDPYDDWFAEDAAARNLKLDHLAEIILQVNGGNGPDILACCEVESVQAADLLRDRLNAKLPAGNALRYEHLAMRELARNAGRFIAPCVISKFPLDDRRTKLLGSRNLRILETHVVANGHDLTVIASHWTSQLTQKGGGDGDEGRERYAATIAAEVARVVRADLAADLLVCGDFNDTPESDPVAHTLHLTADRAAVVEGAEPPRLFGLLSGRPPREFGTLVYDNKPLIYDQIGVSAGLLDGAGWGCDADSVRVPTDGMTRGPGRRPWQFGKKGSVPAGGRGYADHFPVVVNLTVGP